MRRPLSYRDQVAFLDLWERQTRMLDLSYKEIVRRFPPSGRVSGPNDPVFAQELIWGYARLWVSRDLTEAEIALAQTAMALVAYKNQFGSYPASLSELRDRLGWGIPEDPLSGKGFIYKRMGKGFLLYSIGMNLKDDGGRTEEEAHTGSDANRYDIVWKAGG